MKCMPNKRVALFDFCETVVSKQTGDDFVGFTLKKNKMYVKYAAYYFYKSRLYTSLCRFLPAVNDPVKQKVLRLLSGLTHESIQTSAREYAASLHKFIIPEVYSDMVRLKEEGYLICIVSAGYNVYIEKFCTHIADIIISNELNFKNNRFIGYLMADDCIGDEKVRRIFDAIRLPNIFFEIGYSDSISDLPMLQLCIKKVVVSFNAKQDWASKLSFDQIVYN